MLPIELWVGAFYNLPTITFWFRRLVLPVNMRKQQVDTIRLKLIKIAARAIHSARSITFKLCSSCPYSWNSNY